MDAIISYFDENISQKFAEDQGLLTPVDLFSKIFYGKDIIYGQIKNNTVKYCYLFLNSINNVFLITKTHFSNRWQ